uniref:Uncharacterized protein n=1 Tax=Sphaerodactylus townsendi TaxID=933632 RepID=A0ACB8F1H7_9SAUR
MTIRREDPSLANIHSSAEDSSSPWTLPSRDQSITRTLDSLGLHGGWRQATAVTSDLVADRGAAFTASSSLQPLEKACHYFG